MKLNLNIFKFEILSHLINWKGAMSVGLLKEVENKLFICLSGKILWLKKFIINVLVVMSSSGSVVVI